MPDQSGYPGTIDNFGTVADNVDYIEARHLNQVNDAINKIETELGTNPKGGYTSVKTALEDKVSTTDSRLTDARPPTAHDINGAAHNGLAGAVENNFTGFDANGKIKDSGNKASDFASTGSLASHTGDTNNPHSTTAAQVGNTTAQWNADKIKGKTINDTDIGDGKVLAYDQTSDTLKYVISGAGGGVSSVTASSPLASSGGAMPNITIQDSSTAQKGAVQLQDSIDTETGKAATPNIVYKGTGEDNRNVEVKYASASTVDVNADILQVSKYNLSGIDLTLDITASGANGLDTGSEAISTWYAVFVIYNPTTNTIAGLLSRGRSQAYTNDPAAGSNVVLNMTDTSGFRVGDAVEVRSSAGIETAIITAVSDNTSITVDVLTWNHTTTDRLVVSGALPGTNTWTPVLPDGYTMWRHVGWVRNNASGDFINPAYNNFHTCVDKGDFGDGFATAYFTKDGSWHDFNLCQILPPGVKWVMFRAYAKGPTNGQIYLRRKGYTVMASTLMLGSSSYYVSVMMNCAVDIARRAQYLVGSGSWSDIAVTVAAWNN